jgi:hypothetical protein
VEREEQAQAVALGLSAEVMTAEVMTALRAALHLPSQAQVMWTPHLYMRRETVQLGALVPSGEGKLAR